MIDWAIKRQVMIPPPSTHDEEDAVDWSAIGRVYEHLACYYLSSIGFKAEIKDAAGYDLLCECPAGKFFKVEVKSSSGSVRNQCKSRRARQSKEFRFGGISNKAAADLFMFFDRTTNYVVIKTKAEISIDSNFLSIQESEFSEYSTNLYLSRIACFEGNPDNSFLIPDPEEELRLNRKWVRDNMDLVEEMKQKGVWQSTISAIFGTGPASWVTRISREHRNSITALQKCQNNS